MQAMPEDNNSTGPGTAPPRQMRASMTRRRRPSRAHGTATSCLWRHVSCLRSCISEGTSPWHDVGNSTVRMDGRKHKITRRWRLSLFAGSLQFLPLDAAQRCFTARMTMSNKRWNALETQRLTKLPAAWCDGKSRSTLYCCTEPTLKCCTPAHLSPFLRRGSDLLKHQSSCRSVVCCSGWWQAVSFAR
jgi:hypothetical protein